MHACIRYTPLWREGRTETEGDAWRWGSMHAWELEKAAGGCTWHRKAGAERLGVGQIAYLATSTSTPPSLLIVGFGMGDAGLHTCAPPTLHQQHTPTHSAHIRCIGDLLRHCLYSFVQDSRWSGLSWIMVWSLVRPLASASGCPRRPQQRGRAEGCGPGWAGQSSGSRCRRRTARAGSG